MEALLVALYALGALIGFGLVIAIHEFGHFIVAKRAGVLVHRFAIGFGPVILRKQWGETEYALCLLPFGGYVAMLGQEDLPSGQDQPTAPDPRSFLAKSAWWRAAIMLGGVAANLVSSVLLLLGLAFAGMPVVPPVVGDVAPAVVGADGVARPSPAAQLGLRQGDRVLSMNGQPVRMFDDLHIGTLMHTNEPVVLEIERDGRRLRLPAEGAAPVAVVYDRNKGGGTIGLIPAQGNRIFAAGGDGALDAPRRGERILAIAGEPTAGLTGQQITARLMPHFGREVAVQVARDGQPPREATFRYGGTLAGETDGAQTGFPVRIASVAADGPCVGLVRPGDVIAAIDGEPVAGAATVLSRLRGSLDADRPIELTLLRDGVEQRVSVQGAWISGARRLGLGLEELDGGRLPILPPGLDGKPSALSRIGVAPGDVILSLEPRIQERAYAVTWATPGAIAAVPVDAALAEALARRDRPGLAARIVGALGGARPPLPPIERLALGTVRERPADLPATAIGLTDNTGSPIIVDLAGTGAEAAIGLLRPGDRVAGLVPGPDGWKLEVARDLGRIHHAVVAVPQYGTALAFDVEAVPYRLSGPGEAFVLVADAAHVMIVKTVQMIPRFFRPAEQGGVDATRTLSGPVGIFRALWMQLELMGFDSYLRLLAFIGLNLVLVNLLPIPITDGGQLLFLGLESATGRPVTGWVRNLAAGIGLVLVIGLMAFTLGLDILRWVGLL